MSSLALDEMASNADLLSTFDVDDMATVALLFLTGYLTIRDEEDLGGEPLYRLGYPNREVRQSLNRSLLRYLVCDSSRQMANSVRLYRMLETNDFAGLETLFQAIYASIPCEWYTNNDIARYEGYYASVFYSYFAALGLNVTVEYSTSHGRLDMAVRFNDNGLPVRVQGGRDGAGGRGDGTVEGEALGGQVPRPRPANPSQCRRVQQGRPQRRRVPGGTRRNAGVIVSGRTWLLPLGRVPRRRQSAGREYPARCAPSRQENER